MRTALPLLLLLVLGTALADEDERRADEDYDEDADGDVVEVASAAVEVTTGGSSFDELGWHDPPLVPPSEVSDEYYRKIDGATDAHMRAGNFKLGYLAMKEAIGGLLARLPPPPPSPSPLPLPLPVLPPTHTRPHALIPPLADYPPLRSAL
jgi:hypothetical protein